MIPCLLCPSPAEQDALCVPCGAKLWAAREWETNAANARALLNAKEPLGGADTPRWMAVAIMQHDWQRSDFLARLEAAKAARLRKEGACAECERILSRDPHKENCSKGMI